MTKRRALGKKNGKKRLSGCAVAELLIALVTFIMLYIMLALAVTPARYDIAVGQPAPNTIKATKDVEDKITTEKLKSDAAAGVKSIYVSDDTVAGGVKTELEEILSNLRSVSLLLGSGQSELTGEQLTGVNERFGGKIELNLDQLNTVTAADGDTLLRLSEDTSVFTMEIMDKLQESHVEESVNKVSDRLTQAGYDEKLVEVAVMCVRSCVRPNYYYDEAATESLRQAEKDKITPITRVKGEVIVSDGEIVTEAQYAMLDALGMIKESTMDIWLYVGIGVIVLIMTVCVGMYLYLFEKEILAKPKKVLIISVICVITVLCCILAREINVYVMPLILGLLLTAILVKRRAALFINIPLSVLASMLASASGSFFNMATYTVVISSLVSGVVALRVLKTRQTRIAVLSAGILAGAAGIPATYAVCLVSSSSVMNSMYISLYSGIGGVLAGVICIALVPAFEAVFNVVTTTRLIEFSNPNQPLLRRLLLEAPGTYHHSIIVANLAEAAASEIGANGLLARVGAYYHDIGKLKRPMYFTENQAGDNPHDRTDPRVSTAIITAHPKDGVQLLKENRFPEEIRSIVACHHGDTPVVYFYNKSVKENGEADINDFRYEGPRPSTKEEAVVMLADSVEAATRSHPGSNPEQVRTFAGELVRGKIDDGQLDNCDITFSDINTIINAFVTVLSGAFHERIEYPSVEIPKKHGEAAQTAPGR